MPLIFVSQYEINDQANLIVPDRYNAEGGSIAVAVAVTLLDREVNQTVWAPNKPWFYPIHYGDDMANYQKGIVYAISRWSIEMLDFLGRERSSGATDVDLDKAAGALKYNPETWIYDIKDSLLPRTSSDQMYNTAIKALLRYNERVSKGTAPYRRDAADNLIQAIDRVRKDLGAEGSTIELLIMEPENFSREDLQRLTPSQSKLLSSNRGHFDNNIDDVFYSVKGRMYAYYHLLNALGQDFQKVIKDKGADNLWASMLITMRSGSGLYSLSLSNGKLMSWVVPNHAAEIGFFLLRVDKQLKEISNVLEK